jgi:hypothetical protein
MPGGSGAQRSSQSSTAKRTSPTPKSCSRRHPEAPELGIVHGFVHAGAAGEPASLVELAVVRLVRSSAPRRGPAAGQHGGGVEQPAVAGRQGARPRTSSGGARGRCQRPARRCSRAEEQILAAVAGERELRKQDQADAVRGERRDGSAMRSALPAGIGEDQSSGSRRRRGRNPVRRSIVHGGRVTRHSTRARVFRPKWRKSDPGLVKFRGEVHELRVFRRPEPAARAGAGVPARTLPDRPWCARCSIATPTTTPICGARSPRWAGPRR